MSKREGGGVIKTENVCECFCVCVSQSVRGALFGLELRPKLETQIFDSKIFFLFLQFLLEVKICVCMFVCVSKKREKGMCVCIAIILDFLNLSL